jgi:hypothetical protein
MKAIKTMNKEEFIKSFVAVEYQQEAMNELNNLISTVIAKYEYGENEE